MSNWKVIRHARDGSVIVPDWILELDCPRQTAKPNRTKPIILKPVKCTKRKTRAERERTQGTGWTREQWLEVLEKYGKKCLRCFSSDERIVPDHITPLSKDGAHSLENIQPLCWRCNMWKGLRIIDFRPISA